MSWSGAPDGAAGDGLPQTAAGMDGIRRRPAPASGTPCRLPPTISNMRDAAVTARDIFDAESPPPESLYVFTHCKPVGRRGGVRTVVSLHRTRVAGWNRGQTMLCELRRVQGGTARDYFDKMAGAIHGGKRPDYRRPRAQSS